MGLEQKLSLKLTPKLVMTPSLQQAIKLLQMTRLELEGVLTQELVVNRVLEERELTVEDEREEERDDKDELEEALSDIDIEAYFNELETWEGTGQPSTYEERQGPPLENTLSRDDDLYDPPHPIEDELFVAMARIHELPPDQAVEVAVLAASVIGAFLADTARLSPRAEVARLARAQLESLHEDCGRLLEELRAGER